MKKVFAFMISLFLGSVCLAASSGSGVLMSLGLLRYEREVDGPTIGNGKGISSYYDFKLGYLIGNDVYVGGIYSTYGHDDGVTQPKRSLYGATAGYHSDGWFLDLSYFLGGNYELSSTVNLKNPSGLGIDVGYQAMVNSNFFLGIQGSYKSVTFKEVESSNVVTKEDNKIKSELYPMVLLGVIF